MRRQFWHVVKHSDDIGYISTALAREKRRQKFREDLPLALPKAKWESRPDLSDFMALVIMHDKRQYLSKWQSRARIRPQHQALSIAHQ